MTPTQIDELPLFVDENRHWKPDAVPPCLNSPVKTAESGPV